MSIIVYQTARRVTRGKSGNGSTFVLGGSGGGAGGGSDIDLSNYYDKEELLPQDSGGISVLEALFYTEIESDAKFVHLTGAESIAGVKTFSNGIKLDTVEANTVAYVSGFAGAGYKVFKSGSEFTLEVDNLTVRKAMKIYELDISKIKSINGGLIISIANATSTTFVPGVPVRVNFDEDGTNKQIPFISGDYIRAQIWTGRGIASWVAIVSSVTHSATLGNAYIEAVTQSGTPFNNMELVQIGHAGSSSRQNLIYLTASDTNNPYIDVLSGVNAGSFAGKTKVRLGNLTGITDAEAGALSGYGLYSDNVYLKGKITAQSGSIGGWTINSAYLAKDTGTAATSSGMAPTDYPFYAGSTYANRATAPFRVTPAGVTIASKFITSYIIGDDIIGRIDLQYATSSATYVKLQEMTLGADIQGTKTLRITFHLRSSGANDTYARVYRNGVAVGTERNCPNATGGMFTEDITGWAAGDLIQIYAHGTSGTNTAYVKEFRLRGSHYDFTKEVSTTLEPNIEVKATQFIYVDHDRPQPLGQLDDDSATLQIYLNGSASTIYLPLTPTLGRTFIISNISPVNLTVSIATGSGDSILYAGTNVSTVTYGQHRCMTLVYIGGNLWIVPSFT